MEEAFDAGRNNLIMPTTHCDKKQYINSITLD